MTHQQSVELELRELFGNFSDFSIYEGEKGYIKDQQVDWQLSNDGPTEKVNLVAYTRQSENIEKDRMIHALKGGNAREYAKSFWLAQPQRILSRIINQISKHIAKNNLYVFQTFPSKTFEHQICYQNSNGIFLTVSYDIQKYDMLFIVRCLFAFATQEMIDNHKDNE